MTGFGRSTLEAPFGTLTTEILSVNRKHLDVSIFMPKEMGKFEHQVRKWVGEQISRGQVSVRMYCLPNAASAGRLLPNADVLKELKKKWEETAARIGCDPKQIDLPFLMLYSPSLQNMELSDNQEGSFIERGVKGALHELLQMKLQEGEALARDLDGRLSDLETHLEEIARLAPLAKEQMQRQLAKRVQEMGAVPTWDERVLREIVLYVERADVTEEIVRLQSHFHQFRETLHQSPGPAGRKMDFLIQEMGREINTIGSKTSDTRISYSVIAIKTVLEKMREQTQNIE